MGNRLFGLLPPAGAGTKRKEWVDALRALAMFLVIYGHLVQGWTPYFVFTSPVKICMFFAISGYVFKYGRVREKDFYLNLRLEFHENGIFLNLNNFAVAVDGPDLDFGLGLNIYGVYQNNGFLVAIDGLDLDLRVCCYENGVLDDDGLFVDVDGPDHNLGI